MTTKMNNLKERLKNNLRNRKILTLQTPSRASVKSFMYKTFNTNTEICEKDEDFKELQNTEIGEFLPSFYDFTPSLSRSDNLYRIQKIS